MKETNDKVVPGSFLATEEEFVAGKNAFDSNGKLFSTAVGLKNADMSSRQFNVDKCSRDIEPLDCGSTVIGIIEKVNEKSAFVKIREAYKGKDEKAIIQPAAQIPVFNIADQYVESVDDMFRLGDLIKAEVVEVTPYRIVLDTKKPDFGVIKAYCIRCRAPLSKSGNELKCRKCGSSQTRKISKEYSD